jgi:hypothetical protein
MKKEQQGKEIKLSFYDNVYYNMPEKSTSNRFNNKTQKEIVKK